MSRESRRAAFGRCPETCPAIDKVFQKTTDGILDYIQSRTIEDADWGAIRTEIIDHLDRLRETVKQNGTEKLRDALEECEGERIELEEKLDEANEEIKELQGQVDCLEERIASLEEKA